MVGTSNLGSWNGHWLMAHVLPLFWDVFFFWQMGDIYGILLCTILYYENLWNGWDFWKASRDIPAELQQTSNGF